jgi:diguanylate cyclase (GGDEF)-like protein/PAS domain S-box-containing protein
VVLKGNPVYVRSEEITQPFKDQFEDVGIRVMCIVPIKHAERVVACLIIASRLLDEITVSARNSLETIAAEIGNAVDRINSREALLASEQRYRFIAENTNDVIWAMDSKLRYTYISPSVTRQRGYTVEEAMTLNITSVIAPEYIDDVLKRFESMATTSVAIPSSGTNVITQEWEMLRKDGSRFWTESSITVLYNNHGAFSGVLGVTRDITDRKLLEQKLEEMATHDYLTGLPNRKLLEDRFTVASALANRKGDRLSLMTVDLDNFKPVNDTYGHGTGDLVLKAVSARLSGIIRASDTIARIGGDEFLLMLQETNHTQDTRIIAEKIIGAFEEPFIIDGQQHQLSASIGISSYPGDGQDLTILVKKSDDAMYAAKRSGGKRFIFYNEIGKPGPAQGSLFS